MNGPTDQQELNGSRAKTEEAQANLQQLIKGLPPKVQLDALLRAYVTLGLQHGQLDTVGSSLAELGGSILFRHPPMRCPWCAALACGLEA